MTQNQNETQTSSEPTAAKYLKAFTVSSEKAANTVSITQDVRVSVTRKTNGTVKLRYVPDRVSADSKEINTVQ